MFAPKATVSGSLLPNRSATACRDSASSRSFSWLVVKTAPQFALARINE